GGGVPAGGCERGARPPAIGPNPRLGGSRHNGRGRRYKRHMRLARFVPLFFLVAGIVLIPWTIWLTFNLPMHHESDNWRTVWAGFDIAEAAALTATAVL